MPQITGATQLLGVIGDPITHSLSPLMHNAALEQMHLDYVYIPFAIKAAHLPVALQGFEAMGLVGFNITIPHKQAIIPLLAETSTLAQNVGAVNTVRWTEQGWVGTNTDVEGFLAPLQSLERDWSQTQAIVLGNGGAARAVVAGLNLLGLSSIQVLGRNQSKLDLFSQSWQAANLASQLQVHAWDRLPQLLPQASLVVNTTPVGMASHSSFGLGLSGAQSPLSADQIAHLPGDAIVYDLIYVPNPTPLLQMAQDRGVRAIDGLEMLVQQGAAALQLWTQQTVPVATMRRTLQEHLGITQD
jgi:shikimate dehydrogenase